MDRRSALKLFSSLSALSITGPVFANKPQKKVVVIGAGLIGASAAYYLSQVGCKVTLIDQLRPASHATRGTFAWLNATWAKQPQDYHHLNQLGLREWHAIAPLLKIPVRWNGSIEWFSSAARTEKLEQQIAEQIEWGEPASMLDANSVRQKEPNIRISDNVTAAFSANDGAVDPIFATQCFIDAATHLGAQVVFPCTALSPIRHNGKITGINTTQGAIAADDIVVTTGANPTLPEILSGIPIPQRTTPGVISITEPLPKILNTIVAAPGVHLHQRLDGRVVLGEQSGPPEGAAHEMRLKGRPNDFPDPALAKAHGERILATAKPLFPALEQSVIAHSYIGWRPLPLDGHPVLGHSIVEPNVYLAIMHSGISLGPLAGKIIAQEVGLGETSSSLARYRPHREFKQVVRY